LSADNGVVQQRHVDDDYRKLAKWSRLGELWNYGVIRKYTGVPKCHKGRLLVKERKIDT
jgi:hypothetical protein